MDQVWNPGEHLLQHQTSLRLAHVTKLSVFYFSESHIKDKRPREGVDYNHSVVFLSPAIRCMFAVMEIAVESAASNISLSKGYSLSFPSISTIYLTSIAKVGL